MNWSSLTNIIFTFINLIFIGINAYLTHEARTLPYRQLLYSKQLEGYSKVVDALTDFYVDTRLFIAANGGKVDDKKRPILSLQTKEKFVIFHSRYQKWGIFLPNELNDRLCDYIELYRGISAHPNVAYKFPIDHVEAEDPAKLLNDAYVRIFFTAREYLGTEYLSKKAHKLFRKKGTPVLYEKIK